MTSPRPWKLDENDPSCIYDADGEMIAENYKFLHVDDFEGLVQYVNKIGEGLAKNTRITIIMWLIGFSLFLQILRIVLEYV